MTEPLTMTPREYCDRFNAWVKLAADVPHVTEGAGMLRLAVQKSCLLDRLIYCGEMPSQTPCPVHKGKWSGIQWGHPGSVRRWLVDHDGHPAGHVEPSPVDPVMQQRYDDGCRCFQHKCGCTTGWQPDEHCGCVPVPA